MPSGDVFAKQIQPSRPKSASRRLISPRRSAMHTHDALAKASRSAFSRSKVLQCIPFGLPPEITGITFSLCWGSNRSATLECIHTRWYQTVKNGGCPRGGSEPLDTRVYNTDPRTTRRGLQYADQTVPR